MEINGIEVDLDLRYSEMNLSQGILKALDQKGFTLATPVQAGAIPCFKDWKDVIAKAPTGSGKTFAFGIPMVEHTDPQGTDVTGLILAPTRELAMQIQDELRQLCAFLPGIRVACLYGGQPIDRQINLLKKRPQISQYRIKVDMGGKVDLLVAILEKKQLDRVIVFCNTKNTTDRITGLLRMKDVAAQCIHGDLSQKVREKVLSSFRAGQLRVLVATDVAARGLDIDDVDAVINYDIPEEGEYYVHRIGRTGRAKHQGAAYNLISSVPEDIRLDQIARNNQYDVKTITL